MGEMNVLITGADGFIGTKLTDHLAKNNFSVYALTFSKNNISEFGYSIGLGYKFKSVGNQIDFTYHSSLRSHDNDSYGEEIFRGFQVGISIADIWFIKRRQR